MQLVLPYPCGKPASPTFFSGLAVAWRKTAWEKRGHYVFSGLKLCAKLCSGGRVLTAGDLAKVTEPAVCSKRTANRVRTNAKTLTAHANSADLRV